MGDLYLLLSFLFLFSHHRFANSDSDSLFFYISIKRTGRDVEEMWEREERRKRNSTHGSSLWNATFTIQRISIIHNKPDLSCSHFSFECVCTSASRPLCVTQVAIDWPSRQSESYSESESETSHRLGTYLDGCLCEDLSCSDETFRKGNCVRAVMWLVLGEVPRDFDDYVCTALRCTE